MLKIIRLPYMSEVEVENGIDMIVKCNVGSNSEKHTKKSRKLFKSQKLAQSKICLNQKNCQKIRIYPKITL